MPDTQTTDTSKYRPKNIPLDLILYYVETKGLNQTETANLLGCDSSVISRRLKGVDYKPGYLQKFKEGRADILAFHQQQILKQYTPERLKKAGLTALNACFGTLYDKERLERDKSTVNVAYADMVKVNQVVTAKIEAFEARHGIQEAEIIEDSEI